MELIIKSLLIAIIAIISVKILSQIIFATYFNEKAKFTLAIKAIEGSEKFKTNIREIRKKP